MATPDRPQINLVLSDLKKEVEAKRPEPFVIGLSKSQRVTFKYPLVYKTSEREEFQKLISDALERNNEWPLMERMLSEADLAKYKAEDLDDDVHTQVLEALGNHFGFSQELAEEGKDSASEG